VPQFLAIAAFVKILRLTAVLAWRLVLGFCIAVTTRYGND